jgi:hypothetical protein
VVYSPAMEDDYLYGADDGNVLFNPLQFLCSFPFSRRERIIVLGVGGGGGNDLVFET